MRTPITKEQKEKYLEGGGNQCPVCLSGDIAAGEFNTDDSLVWRKVECEDCGAEWDDEYRLVGISEIYLD